MQQAAFFPKRGQGLPLLASLAHQAAEMGLGPIGQVMGTGALGALHPGAPAPDFLAQVQQLVAQVLGFGFDFA